MNAIRQHIRAVRQTRQITNAMYLLSTSRMKRMMRTIDYAHEYYRRVRSVVKGLLATTMGLKHPYLTSRPVNRVGIIVITGDKGMCGAYNQNAINLAMSIIGQYSREERPYIASIGSVGTEYLQRRGIHPDYVGVGVAQNPTLYNARFVVEDMLDMYDRGIVDEVYQVSTRFINTMTQKAQVVRVLPLNIEDFTDVNAEEAERLIGSDYHPSPEDVFSTMVPQYAVGLFYASLAESIASEHCARMNSMQSATKNADDMVKNLQTRYNTVRQFAITQEISEIAAAAKWLKK